MTDKPSAVAEPYIINGCDTPWNGQPVFPRLEIAELARDDYQFSVFVRALAKVQAPNYKIVPASWQEMGGIHGLPYTKWSGDPAGPNNPTTPPSDDQWGGYCYHGSILFPTWHRVYVMLVEQSIWKEGQEVIKELFQQFPNLSQSEKDKWNKAALTLRFPYWDWSTLDTEEDGLPKVFSYDFLRIKGGKPDKNDRVINPLKSFVLNSPVKGAEDIGSGELAVYFASWKQTYRWATGGTNPDEDFMELDEILRKGQVIKDWTGRDVTFLPISVNRSKLARMFSFPPEPKDSKLNPNYWDVFSNTNPQSPPPPEIPNLNSIEDPHNKLHLDIGGSGDMAWNEMAGFDPIFFFHHCNVDRLYALWEYLYPDYWIGTKGYWKDGKEVNFTDLEGTYQDKHGNPITSQSILPPFRKKGGAYWTSDDVRNLGPNAYAKYYTYKPWKLTLTDNKGNKIKDVVIDVTKPATLAERTEYITAIQQYFGLKFDGTEEEAKPPIFSAPMTSLPKHVEAVRGFRDFVIIAILPKYAFRGPHRLEVYLDEVFVGDVAVFSRLHPEKCANCSGQIAAGNTSVRGSINIPHRLIIDVLKKNNANNEDISEEEVLNVIKKSLVARITRPNGAMIAQAAPGLLAAGSVVTEALHEDIRDAAPVPIETGKTPAIQLFSSRVLTSHRDERHAEPLDRGKWSSHGTVLDDQWVAVPTL